VRIAAPPEVVFPYFTDPQLMVTWIGERADLDARPGGKFALDFRGVAARSSYVAVEPPQRVVFTWGIPEDATLPPGRAGRAAWPCSPSPSANRSRRRLTVQARYARVVPFEARRLRAVSRSGQVCADAEQLI